MGFLKSLIFLMALFLCSDSFSSGFPYGRAFRDMKLPTQKMVEFQTITNAATTGTADILNADDGPTSANAISTTTFVAQPDITRNIVITPGSTTADVASCTINVVGTDFHGQSMNEDFVFAENASSATTGAKAFKTVTSVDYPASCEDSPFEATWSIGYGSKLGLKRCLAQAGHVFFTTVDGAKESTGPTVVKDIANIEGNTADFNATLDGVKDLEIMFIQNFAKSCQP